jgi:hypothetical protein
LVGWKVDFLFLLHYSRQDHNDDDNNNVHHKQEEQAPACYSFRLYLFTTEVCISDYSSTFSKSLLSNFIYYLNYVLLLDLIIFFG